MGKVHVYVCLQIVSNKATAEKKLSFFLVGFSFLLAGSSLWPKRSGTNHVAACSTALRSATEMNEMGSYVTVPCPSEMTQRSSTAGWLKLW